MTESRCIPMEQLARVRELPAGSAERAHVDACPRCRARLVALAEFERTDVALPREAGAEHAIARLDAEIEALTSAPAVAARAPEGPGWLMRLFAPPAVRFAGAFAALVLVAAAGWLVMRPAGESLVPGERVVRGDGAVPGAPSLASVADGWEITWPAVAGAESYDVVFLDAELRELGRVTGVTGTMLSLRRGALPAGISPGTTLLIEIDARAGGGVLEMTTPIPVTLR